ncbi:MAG TPA: ABC transporter transmembrane domain-containing protein, partial [Agitococcus sp.]|nr:ABC transporter transmembrane domain-containing protein [Agitococcus sp.]
LPMPFIIWGSFFFQKKIAPYYGRVRDLVGALNQKLMNNLSGIVTIKSYTTEKAEAQNIRVLSDDYRLANHKVVNVSSAFTPIIRMFVEGGFVFTLVKSAFLVRDGLISGCLDSVLSINDFKLILHDQN